MPNLEDGKPRIDIGTFEDIVEQFNKAWDTVPDFGLRLRLINEELGEMVKEEGKGNRAGEEHEWADLLFVVIGTGMAQGYDMGAAMAEVARKNWDKMQRRAEFKMGPSGKLLKPGSDQEFVA